jgi:predicted phosphodiesterase
VDLGAAERSIEGSTSGPLAYVLHDLADLDLDPAAAGFAMVVSGHTHAPRVERSGSVLYLNPGSAGPRRFRLPVTVAKVFVSGAAVSAEIVEILEIG